MFSKRLISDTALGRDEADLSALSLLLHFSALKLAGATWRCEHELWFS